MNDFTTLTDRLEKLAAHLVTGTVLLFLATGTAAYGDFDDPFDRAGLDSQQQRGAYLTRAGNCMGCHTARGGQPFAGGRRLTTAFGVFVTPNITPDEETGIGNWTEADFWQALHEGKSPDGQLLYPAFPYTEYTKVTRQDANAIFAYLQSLPVIRQTNPPHAIRFPYNFRPLLHIWRALYFTPGEYVPDSSKTTQWNRGAYLVQGLGHCNACHTNRSLLGGADNELAGGQIMGMNWYAPSLTSHLEAGSSDWTIDEIVALLSIGITDRAVASGPMATIIRQSLQHLSKEDLRAMAEYLQSISDSKSDYAAASAAPAPISAYSSLMHGEQLYQTHCQDCHGVSGEGVPGIYPPLAGNRGVVMTSPLNTIRSILEGGYPATTKGNPRPYGMPPFQQILHDYEIANLVSYIRNAWGNSADRVTVYDVEQSRRIGVE
ncbi:cytochrome c [Nitrosomonas marina]|uniref:Cytochrome c, mono-and diheme variants n=1 Tax=Nitrosomonas marina TaxID=917 RepID=A0A1H8AJZ1_9PROT|nr:cytochrome c [Nitrosomonas marina]SEM71040.1 Cytochrome c, mono-and diheme variants [Nitrosomonas marina]